MSNSSLVNYTRISPNKTSPRNHKIDTITIHHMAGNLSVETCGSVFATPGRGASSNYGIGSDGRIGLYVDEGDRSWCSSSSSNDNRAITIEVANDGGAPDWHISDKAIKSLIKLCADICKRNNIKKLIWKGDKSLVGQVSKQNMTVHQWFAATACPGPYLYSLHPYIAQEVNKLLQPVKESTSSKQYYRVRKSWKDSKSQLGAYTNLSNAKKKANENPGYFVFDEAGKQVYPEPKPAAPSKPKFPACPFRVRVTIDNLAYRREPSSNSPARGVTHIGSFTIVEVKGDWGKLKSGAGWILLKDSGVQIV